MGAHQTTRPATLQSLEIIMNSNHNLRFPRTYREATGRAFYTDEDNSNIGDKLVAWVVAIGVAFILGMSFGASL